MNRQNGFQRRLRGNLEAMIACSDYQRACMRWYQAQLHSGEYDEAAKQAIKQRKDEARYESFEVLANFVNMPPEDLWSILNEAAYEAVEWYWGQTAEATTAWVDKMKAEEEQYRRPF